MTLEELILLHRLLIKIRPVVEANGYVLKWLPSVSTDNPGLREMAQVLEEKIRAHGGDQ